jgi:uncharacterized membrane protein YphA (DoxX/SURF4 family)
MFPQGGPGFGLVLLRVAAAGMFVLNVTHRFNFSTDTLYLLVISLVGLITLGLLLGIFTPVLAIITCLAALPNLFLAEQPVDVVYIIRILTSAALFFIGPGAYSIDAKLFGLQVTVVPPRKDKKPSTLN